MGIAWPPCYDSYMGRGVVCPVRNSERHACHVLGWGFILWMMGECGRVSSGERGITWSDFKRSM